MKLVLTVIKLLTTECCLNVLESEYDDAFLFTVSSHMFSMTQKIQASSALSVSETCLRIMDQNWTLKSWRFFLPWLMEMLTERYATRILLTW